MSLKSILKKLLPASIARLQQSIKKQNELHKEHRKEIKKLKKEGEKALEEHKALLDEHQKELDNLNEQYRRENEELQKQLKALAERVQRAENDARFCKSHIDNRLRIEKHDYLRNSPESVYVQELADWFFRATGERLELDNPVTFNQKVQWLKLFDTTPLKTRLSDKYLVRDWVAERVGEKYLTKLLGVWERFDDIDFDKLPNKFVLKANHGCAFNYIVPDKSKFSISDARFKFTSWLQINYAYRGLEPQYRDIKPMIIAEEYLENDNKDLYDYKIWCFDGVPKYIQYIIERNKGGAKMAFFDTNWNKMPFISNNIRIEEDVEKPENLDEMLEIAKTLSQGFCYVCVDLYHLNDNTIKFGEMTFTRANGACHWNPPEYNEIIGNMITLPEKKPFFKTV